MQPTASPPLQSSQRSRPDPSWAAPGASGRRARHALLLAVPGLLAAALAGYHLAGRSLWLDEGATLAIASQHGAALWRAIAHDGGNMLVYYLLIHGVIGVLGDGTVALRLPSLLASAATAALTAEVALRLWGGPRIALGSGLLTAVSLPLVFWAQDARGYALMVALATASFLAFLVLLDSPGPAPIAAYVLSTALALYVGFDAGLIVLAELALLVRRPERARAVLGCLIVVALACVPLAVLALSRGSSQVFWVPGVSGSVLGQAGATLSSAGLPPNFHTTGLTIVTAAVTAVLAVGAVWRLRRDAEGGTILAWLLVPVAVGLIVAAAGEPIELARAWILVIPALAIVLAAGLGRPLLWIALAALLALRIAVIVPTYGVSPEDWRAAAAHVLRAQRPGDCIAFYPQDGRMPFDAYVTGTAPTPVLPNSPWRAVRPYVERYSVPSPAALDRIARSCPRLWLLASHEGQRSGPPASRRNLARYHRLELVLARRYPHAVRRRYGYAAVVRVTLYRR